ncbi:TetR/AcrR family transcriptional regulator [Curtobacterium sp. VKM Ac-2861]|uniref:TetR/AcrR family transcriptional regulator n=1 Tax=unclassified Curtobacterium TaxID=257496 RepID=UPI001564D454|nr:TetR/AcrR family transcriptional regulator [Curtobacterium sp. MWU13-2055]NQW89156.1 TetR/AcrR family transcriptional regulator [Curtobacterium sp. VKM Ac-2861]
MARSDETLRNALLSAAEEQLVASPDGDIATRAVCEAVGVTQPVLYRIFGDKRGLLDALAETGLQRYTQRKAELEASDDPSVDLRRGWDDHLAFAREHAALYRLMFAPRPWANSAARDGLTVLLERTLTRCAAAGLLRVDVPVAATMLLAANVGLALDRMSTPARHESGIAADALRDAVLSAVLVVPPGPGHDDLDAAPLRQLRAQLDAGGSSALLPEEAALMRVWLDRLDPRNDRGNGGSR